MESESHKSKILAYTIPVGDQAFEIVLTPDGKIAVVANANAASFSVINTEKNEVIKTLPAGLTPFSVAILTDSKRKEEDDDDDED